MSKKSAPAASEEDVRIYLGPTLHRRVMVHAACFRGGLSEAVKGIIERCPEVGGLIVPVENAAKTKDKIDEPGTEQHRLYEYLRGVRFGADGEVRE